MASQNLNVGTSANSNDGDTLRGAFIKLKQMFAEVYGQTYSEQGDLSGTDFKINESKLQLTASGTASDDGKVLTYDHATGGFSWEDAFTGTIGDITGIVAGDGLTGSSLSSDEATINVVAGTGITVAADSVSLATSVQDEITANTAKTGITSGQASEIAANTLKVGITTAQAGEIVDNNDKVSNVTHTGDVTDASGVLTIANNVVNATKLDVTGDGTAGQLLQSDGDGSMTWVTGVTGDITAVTAGDGLTGGGTAGDVTVSLDATVAGDGLTLTTGVLSVDTIQTGDVADDAITSPKLAEFDDTFTAGTTGDIIVSNGTDFIHATMSGDATIVAGGAITISDNVIDADKLDVVGDGTAGQILTSDGDGSMSWATGVTGDITSIIATDGLTTPDGTAGDVTIGLATGVAGDGLTLASGVLSVDTIETGDIADDAVTYAKMQNVSATDIILGRDSAGAGVVEEITPANLRTMINVEDGANAYAHPNHTGDVTSTADGATVIATDAVTTDKILDDAVDYDKLSAEFTTSTGITVAANTDVDWSTAAMFTATSSIAMDLDFTNAEVGQVKTIIVTDSGGTSALTFDNSMTITTLNGSYSATAGAVNYIQAVCTAANTFFLTISQAA